MINTQRRMGGSRSFCDAPVGHHYAASNLRAIDDEFSPIIQNGFRRKRQSHGTETIRKVMRFFAEIILSLLIGSSTSYASDRQFILQNGAVGAIYLIGETKDSVDLKLVFPAKQVLGYPDNFYGARYGDTAPVTAKGKMVLFDGKGPLFTINKLPPLILAFWCENDGGTQFRPEARLTLRKAQLKRRFRANPDLQGLAGFVFHKSAPNTSIGNVSIPKGTDVRLRGDLYGNGQAQAVIWVQPDEAQNCDGKPDNNLTIHLKTEKNDGSLRCCGP